ncbi:MAG: hypothetical protein CMJ19_16645 [Phycisphaeraceae bacterium]|nr:hypothetical protein [Phycisphaeraceae bacterium]
MVRWDDMLAQLGNGQPPHWRDRLAMAQSLMDAVQTGQVVEYTTSIRQLLEHFANDPKWEVRKVIANGLYLVDDDLYPELVSLLTDDPNGFVKRAAEQSDTKRRQTHRLDRKRETVDRQLASRLTRLRNKYGPDAVDDVMAISEIRFNQLAGSMAHDLRSVLTHLQPAARGLNTALDETVDIDAARRKTSRVLEGLAFIERCVSDMERYTEPIPPQQQAEDVGEVLTAACEMAAKNIEELGYDPRNITLRQDVPDGLRLRMSKHLIILAVANLVKNAYESFMEQHEHLRSGKILITADQRNDEVQISIRDNGMGMASEHLTILDSGMPRRRNKAKRKSTGFGVPIARRYIEAHSGTLAFASSEDAGTTALITFKRKHSPTPEANL